MALYFVEDKVRDMLTPEVFFYAMDKMAEKHNFKNQLNCDKLAAIVTPEWFDSTCSRIFQIPDFENLESMKKFLPENDFRTFAKSSQYVGFENKLSCWYHPYHFMPRSKWGVHIRYDSWMGLAKKLNDHCPNLINRPLAALRAGFLFFYIHTYFHFLVENMFSEKEMEVDKPDLYIDYYNNSYYTDFNSDICLEESLATLFLYLNKDYCNINQDYMELILKNQQKSYEHFQKFEDQFVIGLCRLMNTQDESFAYTLAESVLNYYFNSYDKSHIFKNCNLPVWLHYTPLPSIVS